MAPHRDERAEEPAGLFEERRATRPTRVASCSLTCPRCDAPIALAGTGSLADALWCPFCDHGAALRDFVSLSRRPQTHAITTRFSR